MVPKLTVAFNAFTLVSDKISNRIFRLATKLHYIFCAIVLSTTARQTFYSKFFYFFILVVYISLQTILRFQFCHCYIIY